MLAGRAGGVLTALVPSASLGVMAPFAFFPAPDSPGPAPGAELLLAQKCNAEIRPSGGNRNFRGGVVAASCNGYRLILQGDGNLVLYSPGGQPLWATGTDGQRGTWFSVQADGNMVLYSSASKPLWASDTSGSPGSFLAVQADGNLVVYTKTGSPLWASQTQGGRGGDRSASRGWLDARSSTGPIFPLFVGSLPRPSLNCAFGDKCVGGGNTHAGVDYPAAVGRPVRAICDGKVRDAHTPRTRNEWDRFTVIEHKNCANMTTVVAYYGHIDATVRVGASVRRGQQIGTISKWEKRPNNSHLHLGLATYYTPGPWGYLPDATARNGSWLDPQRFPWKFR